jgi:hypothetical protein
MSENDGEFSKLELLIEQFDEIQQKINKTVSNLIIDRALNHKQQLAISSFQQTTIDLNKSLRTLQEQIAVGKHEGRY